jgi:hypothetical protein
MGTVYRAYHAQLARTGAVKVMHAISPDADSIARFRHEAQAIARMRHPNILNVFDFGEYEGTPYMIVEYVPGGNLAGRLTQGLLSWGTALRFLHGIAAGLDYAHSQGIVHRDVKPANVLLEKDETLVLADFGLAKLLRGSSVQSMTGVTTGTPAYMAPEQVTGHEVGPAADRYSLATIAYEMLTGSIPFEGQGLIELLYAHVHSDPARPSTVNPELNEKVDAVIMRGLAKAPGSRWPTCEAFVNALAAALGAKASAGIEKTVVMAAAPAVERTVANGFGSSDALFAPPPATVPPPVWGPAVAEKRRARRRRIAFIVIAVIALLALLAATLSYVFGELFKPSFALSSQTVEPGSILTVSAAHLPPNQVGEIHLQSELYTFAFTADPNGSLADAIAIPLDIGIGGHHVSLCWDGSCPLVLPLRVVAPGTLPSPSSAPPSAVGNAGATPSPRTSARPGSSPTANPPSSPARPTSNPSPKPTHSPKPSPTPVPANPCPTSTSAATLSGPSSVNGGANFTVTGANFTPNKAVTVRYYDPSTSSNSTIWTGTVACNGTFSHTFTAAGNLLGSHPDKVSATDAGSPSRSKSYTFALKALLL